MKCVEAHMYILIKKILSLKFVQFSTKLDELLDNLCSETAASDVPSAENAIQMLDVRLNTIGFHSLGF